MSINVINVPENDSLKPLKPLKPLKTSKAPDLRSAAESMFSRKLLISNKLRTGGVITISLFAKFGEQQPCS